MDLLENQIQAWRKQMLSAGIQTPVPLKELESHLRDEIAHLMQSGLDVQTAFDTAAQKIGNTPALKNEFAKVHRAITEKKIVTVFVPRLVPFLSLLIAVPTFLKVGAFSEMTPRQRMSCIIAAAAMSFLCWAGVLLSRYFPVIAGKRRRDYLHYIVGALLILWWVALFCLVLPGTNFNMPGLLVALFWGYFMPYGIFAGFMAGLEKAAARRPKTCVN
jgi:hypothetical protein